MITNWTLQDKVLILNKRYSEFILQCNDVKETFKVIREPSGYITIYKDNKVWYYSDDMIRINNELDILLKATGFYKSI